jgi:hypothetical protein
MSRTSYEACRFAFGGIWFPLEIVSNLPSFETGSFIVPAVANHRFDDGLADEPWNMVKPQLKKRWSPEEVAEWLKKEYPDYAVSGKTVYTYVFSP